MKRGPRRSCGKLIASAAGSAIEEVQNCHIGDYMEGYLTHEANKCFKQQRYAVAAAFLRTNLVAFSPTLSCTQRV
ncbi:hypothetical protein D1839_01815 [Roseburia sp. 1XD42-34]|nr:hypothetical protein [Roseburia sp. 1XD42-34]RKI81984.1 hypothetical protein D7V87_01815 [Clostridium sp. 1xD42-85]